MFFGRMPQNDEGDQREIRWDLKNLFDRLGFKPGNGVGDQTQFIGLQHQVHGRHATAEQMIFSPVRDLAIEIYAGRDGDDDRAHLSPIVAAGEMLLDPGKDAFVLYNHESPRLVVGT